MIFSVVYRPIFFVFTGLFFLLCLLIQLENVKLMKECGSTESANPSAESTNPLYEPIIHPIIVIYLMIASTVWMIMGLLSVVGD